MSSDVTTLRIFISSPGDVAAEREKAKQVIAHLQKWYGPSVSLIPVLWEDLPLEINMGFQQGIDLILSDEEGIDIAVFILWLRIGTPVTIGDRTYNSGTEREFDMMLHALEASGGERPEVLFYQRDDDEGFAAKLSDPRNQDHLEALIKQRNLAKSFIQENFWEEGGQNIRAYHNFNQPVEFAGRLKVHLQGLIDKRLENSGQVREARWTDRPYRGLEVFEQEHADIFFGREKEIVELENRLRSRENEKKPTAFVVVIGASGSGKSSLVRAGLQSSLVRFNLDESISEWRSVVMTPAEAEGELIFHLLDCLARPNALPELTESRLSLAELAENLAESPTTTINLAIKPLLKTDGDEPHPKLLVIVDQFEELFTDERISSGKREDFLLTLEALAQSGVWVVATMRSDFFPLAQQSEIFLRLKGENGQFDLLPPSPEALRRIITEPARMAGVRFENRAPESGGQSVVGKIMEDAREDPDMLPLLSDLLLSLYQLRTAENLISFAAYESLGDEKRTGLEGALSKRAEKEFMRLTEEQRSTSSEILHALVTIEADADVRRRANLDDLRDTPQKAALVDALIDARLLTADSDKISLAHEALLRKWDRVADWVHENRHYLRIRSRVERSMQIWEEENRNSTLLLSEGVRLTEGVELLRNAPHLLGGKEYESVRNYIDISEQHYEEEESRARRIRHAVMVSLCLLTILAFAGAGVALVKQREASRNLTIRNHRDAIAWVERARAKSNDRDHFGAVLMAAKGLGFEGFGKPEVGEEKRNRFSIEHPVFLDPQKPDHAEAKAQLVSFVRENAMRLPFWRTNGHTENVNILSWNRDGTILASGSEDGSIILWDADGNLTAAPVESSPVTQAVTGLAWSPDGKFLLGASMDGSIKLWNRTGEMVSEARGLPSAPVAPVWSHSSDRFASVLKRVSRVGESTSPDGAGSVQIWDTEGKPILLFACPDPIVSLRWNPGSELLAGLSENGAVYLWDILKRESQSLAESNILAIGWSHDGKSLVGIGPEGTMWIWESKKSVPTEFRNAADSFAALACSPALPMMATGSIDGSVKFWRPDGEMISSFDSLNDEILSLKWKPDGTAVVVTSTGGKIFVVGTDGECLEQWNHSPAPPSSIAWTPDGQSLVTGTGDGVVYQWNSGGERKGTLGSHSAPITALAWKPRGGELLASGSFDGAIRIWSADGELLEARKKHLDSIESLEWISGGSGLASASRDGSVILWKLDGNSSVRLSLNSGVAKALAWNPAGEILACGTGDGSVHFFDGDGKPLADLKGHESAVVALEWSPDGNLLVSGSVDTTVRLWSKSGEAIKTLSAHAAGVFDLDWNHDGDSFASGDTGGSIHLWTKNGESIVSLSGHTRRISQLAWQPGTQILASGSWDATVQLWARSGKRIATLEGHTEPVVALGWSSDGKTLASGSWDGSVKLWTPTGEMVASLDDHSNAVTTLEWSSANNRLATGSGDRKIRVFDPSIVDRLDVASFLHNEWVKLGQAEYEWITPAMNPNRRGWISCMPRSLSNAEEIEQVKILDENIVIDPEKETAAESRQNSPWIFFNSDRRFVSQAELASLSGTTLWQARNEIFARRGYIFKSDKGRNFVNSIPSTHYRGVTLDMDEISAQFNTFEIRNIDVIRDYEEQKEK